MIFELYSNGKFRGANVNGTGILGFDNLKCSGYESTLFGCSYRSLKICGHEGVVEIECLNSNESKH